MPSNLPGSNIRDLNKNGCFIWERVRFTITGGSGGIEEHSITNPARREVKPEETNETELFDV